MTEQFIGCSLSIEVGGGLGFYQGTLKSVNSSNQMVTLTKVLHNGKPTNKEVNINAADILNLKVLNRSESGVESKSQSSSSNGQNQVFQASRPAEKKSNNSSKDENYESFSSSFKEDCNITNSYVSCKPHSPYGNGRPSPRKTQGPQTFQPIHSYGYSDVEQHFNESFASGSGNEKRKSRTSVGEILAHVSQKSQDRYDTATSPYDNGYQRRNVDMNQGNQQAPNKKQWNKQRKNFRDETTFGTPIEDDMYNTEFDFEKNLALFNKQAVMEEIQNSKPDVIRQADRNVEPKYKCDENILSPKAKPKRQIFVPPGEVGEVIYVTDNGLLVPSVSTEMRLNLLSTANQNGLTKSRQLEMIGRAATEVIISMIGGSHRLEPGNSHQPPIVVILCGANTQGAAGTNCGRQLESQGVQTVVLTPPIPSSSTPSLLLSQETQLYSLTSGRLTSDTKTLPSTVDLIVDARFDLQGILGLSCESWVNETNMWASASRAPLIALDPPNAIALPFIPKIRLCPALPLAHPPDKGRVYLMNLNIPQQVFTSLGIKYTSPFGAKMAIPLHTCE